MRASACPRTIIAMDTPVSDLQEAMPARSRKAIDIRIARTREPTSLAPPDRGCRGLCFQALERAYESAGGTLSPEQMVQRLRAWSDQPLSMLAHWIVDREVLLISRHDRTLIPIFQFSGPRCVRRPDVANVIAELRPAFDDWELATWFVTPNTWLDEALPVRLIDTDARRVFEAARVDRYVACG
jgi:hypothetical protein